jgi:hypothetical protein
MPDQSDSDNELSPQAREFLKIIQDDMPMLRAVDLGDVPPATVPEAE